MTSTHAAGPIGPILSDASIDDALRLQAAGRQRSGLPDDGARWRTGFHLAALPSPPTLRATGFGHAGAGGQLGFADYAHRVAFAYLCNQMGGRGDARWRELTLALGRGVGA
jgi:CubicO group peptidase (beta-lactamase class C family)